MLGINWLEEFKARVDIPQKQLHLLYNNYIPLLWMTLQEECCTIMEHKNSDNSKIKIEGIKTVLKNHEALWECLKSRKLPKYCT